MGYSNQSMTQRDLSLVEICLFFKKLAGNYHPPESPSVLGLESNSKTTLE